MEKGVLLVLSGPSGSGKGTVVKAYTEKYDDVFVSVSATTRDMREGERYGVNYYYMTVEEFEQKIAENGFLEHAKFCENYYGTPREKVEEMLNAGKDVILEIDVQGAFQVKKNYPDAVLVFTLPPTFEELKARLIGRGTDSMDVVEKRLAAAREEIKRAVEYDYFVLNDDVDKAVLRMRHIFEAEKCSIKNNKKFVEEF